VNVCEFESEEMMITSQGRKEEKRGYVAAAREGGREVGVYVCVCMGLY
jgi:hypothetical protein